MQKFMKCVAILLYLVVAGLFSYVGMYVLGLTGLFSTDLIKGIAYFAGGMICFFAFVYHLPEIGRYIKSKLPELLKAIWNKVIKK